MFFHNFKYSFITLFKDKILIFWTFAFPIILGALFYMAFSDIESSEKLDIINIAVVDNSEFNDNNFFKDALSSVSDETSDNQLFSVEYTSLDRAQELLDNGDISGYLIYEDKPKIVVNRSGINETIFKFTIKEIQETNQIYNSIYSNMNNSSLESIAIEKENLINSLFNEVEKIMTSEQDNIKDISRNNLSYTMIEFYTLIAMACLYGGILGMIAVNRMLANMSNHGKRVSVSPVAKWKLIFSSVCASYLVQVIGLILLFLFTIFILDVNYGDNMALVILLAFIGSLAGLSFGVAVSVILKSNENIKTGIIISMTMLGSFFSGMMGITMKYIIDKNIPIINYVNPASMITDGFYSLYYYDTYDRYCIDIISLIIFIVLMLLLAMINLRRQKYDSI